MTADKCPGDLNVLGSDEVSELFGWPVSLLDEIRDSATSPSKVRSGSMSGVGGTPCSGLPGLGNLRVSR